MSKKTSVDIENDTTQVNAAAQDSTIDNNVEIDKSKQKLIYIPEPKYFTYEQLATTDNLVQVQAKFDLISQRFQSFETKLIQDRDRKLREKQDKIDQIKRAIEEVRSFVRELAAARAEHIRTVQRKLTSMLDEWAETQPPPIHEKLDKIDESIDQMYDRLEALEEKIKSDYASFMKLIQEKVDVIVKILNEFKQVYFNFQENRTEKDSQIIDQLQQLDKKYFNLFKVLFI